MLEIVTLIGLGLVATAWLMLLTRVLQKKTEINKHFVVLYLAGVVISTIGGSNRGLDFIAILNIAIAIIVLLIFLKLTK